MQTAPSQIIFKDASFTSNNDVIRASLFSTQDESSSGGLLSRLKDKISPSQADAYKKQMEDMAHQEKWTLGNFKDQIQAQMGWKTKIPGMGNSAVVQEMKVMKQLLDAAVEVMGNDAGAPELLAMEKKEKVSFRNEGCVHYVCPFLIF